MPHVFLQLTVTNSFIKPKPHAHFIDPHFSLVSLHSIKRQKGLVTNYTQVWYLNVWFLPGQASILQAFSSLLGPLHALPPFLAGVTIVLVLSCTPFPQDLEHFDHSPQEDCLQSVVWDFELPIFFLPPLHMPHVFLHFCDTNFFANAWPHKNAVQCPTLSSHGTTKNCKG